MRTVSLAFAAALVLLASPWAVSAQTSAKDIGQKASETGEAIRDYAVEQKDKAVAHAKRLTRILLRLGAPGQPDRAVAILVEFLFVGLETELMNVAIDGVPTVDSEPHNRIITPVFVQPSVQRGFLCL